VCGGNVELIAISNILRVSASQITSPSTVILGEVTTEKNIFMLFSGEIDNGHCDTPLRVE
jgi:hypothetical protein